MATREYPDPVYCMEYGPTYAVEYIENYDHALGLERVVGCCEGGCWHPDWEGGANDLPALRARIFADMKVWGDGDESPPARPVTIEIDREATSKVLQAIREGLQQRNQKALMTTPTREELERLRDEALEAAQSVTALRVVEERWLAYGAACQALGEHIGRERTLAVAQDLQRGQGISLQEALWLLGGQMPTEQEGGRDE